MNVGLEWVGYFIIIFSVYMMATQAGLFAERSGTVNIAIDGMMVMGALTFGATVNAIDPGQNNGAWAMYVALIVTIIVGMVFSLLLGIATITFGADHIIAGTALNILAPALSWITFTNILGENGLTVSANNYDFKLFGQSGHYFIFLILAIVAFTVTWIVFNKTRFGLRLKAAGENPNALAAVGVNVNRVKYISIMISGAFAAVAGAFAISLYAQWTGSVSGMGFLAIAMLILGRWNTWGILFSSLALSVLAAFTRVFGLIPSFSGSIPDQVFEMIPFIMPLIVMIIFKQKGMPEALGKPYNKEQR